MGSNSERKHVSDFILPLMLFFTFTIMALLLILLSAQTFNSAADNSAKNYDAGTSVLYIKQKIHSTDSGGNIHLGEIDGIPALVIDQTFSGSSYSTYIYEYDNSLRELLTRSDAEALPQSGQSILNISSISFSIRQGTNEDLLYIECTDDNNNVSEAAIALHTAD